MNRFLAKSEPIETIQQHTDKLIENYNLLKSIYPNLRVDWDILKKACLYHDLGKMNKKFQDKIEFQTKAEDEIPHGVLSTAFIPTKELKGQGYNHTEIKMLANAIGYHHERNFNFNKEDFKKELEKLQDEIDSFKYDKIMDLNVKRLSIRYFNSGARISQKDGNEVFFRYILIKGLLNRIDYAASAHIEVEKKNNFLNISLDRLIDKWKEENPNAMWNKLQRYMLNHKDENVIAIAETGMGKTEAGLLWIGNNKGFFTLPLKTAINAMYSRISENIIKEDIDNKLGLLHSDTYSEYISIDSRELDVDDYYNKTKQLSLPLTICTLDQIFDFVYRYRGFESKLATLAYSKVIIDEVQMYSPDLLAYLVIGLYYITKIGGKFAILTATLPKLLEDLLKEENINFIGPQTFINDTRVRHSVKTVEDKISAGYIAKHYNRNKILVICNTVKEAQKIYKEMKYNYQIENVSLFHSNFIKKHRREKEKQILEIGDKKSKDYGVWVTTQVVEASLDIDFDILITELSDLNGLFQRMGRCYRARSFDGEGYNCYVFNGGDSNCSGIGRIIDKEIFKLSKKALNGISGKLKEKDKMDLVRSLYTTENLSDSDYYKTIKNNISYVKAIEENELLKADVKKLFRNIQSTPVIPKKVYNDKKDEIQDLIYVIEKQYIKDMNKEDKKRLKEEKVKARLELMNYTVNIPDNRIFGNIVDELKISRYEYIPILNCKYSFNLGVEYLEKNLDKNKNFADRSL